MHRPIYACDRCGHWYTTSPAFAHNELPYEPTANTNMLAAVKGWDLCESCTSGYPLEGDAKQWFDAGKGAEVKPPRRKLQ